MNLQNIKNLLFDFGGVLYEIATEITIKEFNRLSKVSIEILLSKEFYSEFIAPFEKGLQSAEEFRETICQRLNLQLNDNNFDAIWLKTLVSIYPDSVELISELKKQYRLILLSNTNILHYNAFQPECAELFNLFDRKYFSFQIGFLKPQLEIFEYVSNNSQINPETTLFIDDTFENIQTAKNLGYYVLHLNDRKLLSDLLHTV